MRPRVPAPRAQVNPMTARPNAHAHPRGRGLTGKPRVWFVASCSIDAGDELTWDYGDDYWKSEDEVMD